MKKIMTNAAAFIMACIFFMLSCSSAIYANSKENEEAYLEKQKEILCTMREEMESAEKCGDVNIDFLNEIIPHYKAKIAMSKNMLKYCKSREVKKIGKAIIKDHKKTLEELNEMLTYLKQKPTTNKGKEKEYLRGYDYSYKTMICNIENIQNNGDVGRDYLCTMTACTEGSVNFATNILKFTGNKDLSKICHNIMNLQNKQIVEMKKLYIKMGQND